MGLNPYILLGWWSVITEASQMFGWPWLVIYVGASEK